MMDNKNRKENPGQRLMRYAWVREAMPGVARLITEKRAQWGDAHVNECWRRGVVERQPGWFFAREGAVAIGTPRLTRATATRSPPPISAAIIPTA